MQHHQLEKYGPCACGCGKIIRLIDPYYRIHRFAQGHSNKGEGNPAWKGGKVSKTNHGYVKVCDGYNKNGRVKRSSEHRLVMEKHLGRKLEPYETVHHINHKRRDNRIENLKLFPSKGSHISAEYWERNGPKTITQLDPEFD